MSGSTGNAPEEKKNTHGPNQFQLQNIIVTIQSLLRQVQYLRETEGETFFTSVPSAAFPETI